MINSAHADWWLTGHHLISGILAMVYALALRRFQFPFLCVLGSYVRCHAVIITIVVDVFSAIEASVLDTF